VRKAAAQSFEGLRCCRPELEALLRDDDMWVRFYAVKALAADINEDSVALMISMLGDPEMPVAMSAIDALAQCTSPKAMRALEDLREHKNPVIQEKVREILANLW
jgi:HEAT repeat protein